MIKKYILIALLFANLAYAGVWSSSRQDGIVEAFKEYDNFTKQENDKIVNRYEDLNKGVVTQILRNDELKKELLEKHRELLTSETVERGDMNSEYERLKFLLDNEAAEK